MRNFRGWWNLTTAPATEPVTLTEAKDHLRIDTGPLEDRMSSEQSIVPGAHVVAAAYSLVGASVNVQGSGVLVYLDAGTVPAGATVDAKLQDSPDDLAWTDVTGGAFVQVTPANDNAVQEKAYTGTGVYLRAVATVAVDTSSFSVSVSLEAPMVTDQDTLINVLIATARAHVEDVTSRALITQSWTLTLNEWGDSILLPRPAGISVTEITYADTDGVTQTLAADQYTLLDAELPARIVPADGVALPTVSSQPNSIAVEYVAGYGGAAAVPTPIKQAILILIAHWYENREPVVIGTITAKVPMTVDALLSSYRVWT